MELELQRHTLRLGTLVKSDDNPGIRASGFCCPCQGVGRRHDSHRAGARQGWSRVARVALVCSIIRLVESTTCNLGSGFGESSCSIAVSIALGGRGVGGDGVGRGVQAGNSARCKLRCLVRDDTRFDVSFLRRRRDENPGLAGQEARLLLKHELGLGNLGRGN
ncbi:MAG: hypothetical protein JWR01_2948 [Subtercola sp.]|nr:hypothetical protein [Subtercola sp.]